MLNVIHMKCQINITDRGLEIKHLTWHILFLISKLFVKFLYNRCDNRDKWRDKWRDHQVHSNFSVTRYTVPDAWMYFSTDKARQGCIQPINTSCLLGDNWYRNINRLKYCTIILNALENNRTRNWQINLITLTE